MHAPRAHQLLSTRAADPPAIVVDGTLRLWRLRPMPAATVGLSDVSPHTDRREVDQRLITPRRIGTMRVSGEYRSHDRRTATLRSGGGAAPTLRRRRRSSGAYSNHVRKSNGSPKSRQWCRRRATAGKYSRPTPICRDRSSKMARRSSCASAHHASVFRIGIKAARVACGRPRASCRAARVSSSWRCV